MLVPVGKNEARAGMHIRSDVLKTDTAYESPYDQNAYARTRDAMFAEAKHDREDRERPSTEDSDKVKELGYDEQPDGSKQFWIEQTKFYPEHVMWWLPLSDGCLPRRDSPIGRAWDESREDTCGRRRDAKAQKAGLRCFGARVLCARPQSHGARESQEFPFCYSRAPPDD